MPRLAVPLSVVLRALFDLGLNLAVVFVFILAVGPAPRLAWLEVVPLIALLALFAAAVTLLAGALYVRLRDVAQIWQVLAQMLFFGSPIFYVVTALPDDLQALAVQLNPLAFVFTEMRHALLDPTAPSAVDLAGGWLHVSVMLAVTGGLLGVGLMVFRRMAPHAAENL